MISWRNGTETSPTDVDALLVGLRDEAARLRMSVESLGPVGRDSLLLLRSSVDHGPRVLVAAGFHGEEPAGCWGVLRFLRQATLSGGVFSRVRLSILPVVNPTGIRRGQRNNLWGENPNRGFCHTSGESQPSVEGKLLLKSLSMIRDLAADGFVSLHEDIDAERFYLYTFENNEVPGAFTKQLVAAEARFFTPFPDGKLKGGTCKGGVLYRQCDGSFEDFLFHEGIPRTACTETPGRLAFDRRVDANAHIVDAFCTGAASRHDVSSIVQRRNHTMSDLKTYELSSFSDPSVSAEQERLLVMEGLVEGSQAYRIGDKSGSQQLRSGHSSKGLQLIKKATGKRSRSLSKGNLRSWKKGVPFDDDTKEKAVTKGYAD